MALFRRPPQARVLTAAASRVIDPADRRSRSLATDAEALYGLYRELGPIHAALQAKFLAASKIEYYPARRLEPGGEPERVDDGPAVDAYNQLHGPLGEFPDFIARMSTHWEIAGEGYLVQEVPDGDEVWSVWSPVEYEKKRKNLYVNKTSDDAAGELIGGAFVMRSWRPDPMNRELPDSPLRAIRRECEQYVYLQGMVTAIAMSRLSAGIMKVPSGLSFPPKANGDPADSFFDVLFDAMSSAVNTVDSAARITPTMVEGDESILASLDFLDLTRELPIWVPELMERVLRQMAVGMDLPPEQMTGLGDMNHWGAWLADDSLRLNFVDPLILNVLDSFTRGYLHPYLEEAEVEDVESYLFWRDYSDLTSKVISPDHAIKLAELNAISLGALRRTIGFTEDDAPEESEIPPPPAVTEAFPVGPDNQIQGPPDSIVASAQRLGLGQIDHRLYAQISEVAQAGLDRVLEKAGQKIRSHAVGDPRRPAKHPTLAAALDGVPNGMVGLTLGKAVLETLQLTDDQLIPEGSFDQVGKRVGKILRQGQDQTYETISELGTPTRDETVEDGFIKRAVDFLLVGLIGLSLRRLFTPDLAPDPAVTGELESTQIPAPLVFDTLTLGGGGEPGFGADIPRGLANGQQAQDWIRETGYQITEREWTVGAPAAPFEPHHALRGIRISEYTDPRLTPPITASWLGVSYMFPGDHSGCQCVLELVVDNE